jgi:5'(3')-deoxyribonucleotidase
MRIYLDMDGTLVDFISQVNKYGFWRKDKENKVDWKKVKAMGPRFWSEMGWMPGAEEAFTKLQELEAQKKLVLYILSSIDFEDGRIGKTDWIKEKTNFPLEKVIFCLEPEDKSKWADKTSWLIDDRKKSLEPFASAGGNIIEFTGNWKLIIKKIESLIRE